MKFSVTDSIRSRRSVRTFDKRPLSSEHLSALESYISELTNPFGVDVEFRFLDPAEHGLSSPVLVGESLYLGAKSKSVPNAELAIGYELESFILYAESLGIGTVWIAGTLNRPQFERAMGLSEDEIMPAVTPVGYPAKKMSVRENMMRKGVKAGERLSFRELFFEHDFSTPLTPEAAGSFVEALEMVRLGPSAVNKQPWRIILCGNSAHFYKKGLRGMDGRRFDIQKLDLGIAALHFELTLAERGITGSFIQLDPGIEHANDIEYIATFEVKL